MAVISEAESKESLPSASEGASSVFQQPKPTPDPKADEVAKTEQNGTAAKPPQTRPQCLRWQGCCHRFNRIFFTIIMGVGRVFMILFAAIGVIVLFALCVAITVGSSAANGALMMVIGNAILRAAGRDGYTAHSTAAIVGAGGGILAVICVGLVANAICPKVSYNGEEPQHPWYVRMGCTVLVGTLSGTIGCAIFIRAKSLDLGGLDVLHATRAGALGGTIMGPGSIFLIPAILAVLAIILSPLWIAMMFGLEWMYAKSREEWTDNSHSYSYCYCVGTCGDDPEIQAELDHIHDMENRRIGF